MPETAENVAELLNISRADQDAFALRSQQRTARAQQNGVLAQEIIPVQVAGKKGAVTEVSVDEHPRAGTTLEQLAALKAPFRKNGVVTAGNASGVNDGAAALIIASEPMALARGVNPAHPHCGYGDRGRRAAPDGIRPGARHPQGAGACRTQYHRYGRH